MSDETNIDIGHWTTELHDFNPEDFYGFVYRVVNKSNGMNYIGKKQFMSRNRVKVKGRKNRKIVFRNTNWKKYTTSSNRINEEIEEYGFDHFDFIIIALLESKGALVYAEIRYQVIEDVMRCKLPDGTRKYYNGNISSCKFIPPEETLMESKFRVLPLI